MTLQKVPHDPESLLVVPAEGVVVPVVPRAVHHLPGLFDLSIIHYYLLILISIYYYLPPGDAAGVDLAAPLVDTVHYLRTNTGLG